MAALLVGLGLADEPFLESCLDDRARPVREEACRLLDRLPGSARAARMADRLRPFMRQVINDLVDAVAAQGRADFAADVCEPYPIPIICELLGAPQDWQLFSRWATDLLAVFDADMADKLDSIAAAREALDDYTAQLIDRRRAEHQRLKTEQTRTRAQRLAKARRQRAASGRR